MEGEARRKFIDRDQGPLGVNIASLESKPGSSAYRSAAEACGLGNYTIGEKAALSYRADAVEIRLGKNISNIKFIFMRSCSSRKTVYVTQLCSDNAL